MSNLVLACLVVPLSTLADADQAIRELEDRQCAATHELMRVKYCSRPPRDLRTLRQNLKNGRIPEGTRDGASVSVYRELRVIGHEGRHQYSKIARANDDLYRDELVGRIVTEQYIKKHDLRIAEVKLDSLLQLTDKVLSTKREQFDREVQKVKEKIDAHNEALTTLTDKLEESVKRPRHADAHAGVH